MTIGGKPVKPTGQDRGGRPLGHTVFPIPGHGSGNADGDVRKAGVRFASRWSCFVNWCCFLRKKAATWGKAEHFFYLLH